MIAARIPAANNPPSTFPVCVFTKNGKIVLGLLGSGGFGGINSPVAQTPTKTQGTQTIMMKIGWQITGTLNVLALFAVIQCWNKCGNIPTDSGIRRYVKNLVLLISIRVSFSSGTDSARTFKFAISPSCPPSLVAMT